MEICGDDFGEVKTRCPIESTMEGYECVLCGNIFNSMPSIIEQTRDKKNSEKPSIPSNITCNV